MLNLFTCAKLFIRCGNINTYVFLIFAVEETETQKPHDLHKFIHFIIEFLTPAYLTPSSGLFPLCFSCHSTGERGNDIMKSDKWHNFSRVVDSCFRGIYFQMKLGLVLLALIPWEL